MAIRRRIHSLRGMAGIISAVLAFVVVGFFAIFTFKVLFLPDPCLGRYGFCESPTPLPLVAYVPLSLLLISAVFYLRSRSSWFLLVAWALMVCMALGDALVLLIPAARSALHIGDEFTFWGVLAYQVKSNRIFWISMSGLVLAALSLVPSRIEK